MNDHSDVYAYESTHNESHHEDENEEDVDADEGTEDGMLQGLGSHRGGLVKILRSLRLLGMNTMTCEGVVRVLTAVMLLNELAQCQSLQPQGADRGDNGGDEARANGYDDGEDGEHRRIAATWKGLGMLLGCDVMAFRSENIQVNVSMVSLAEVLYDTLVRTLTRAINQALATLTPATSLSSSSSSLLTLSLIDNGDFQDCSSKHNRSTAAVATAAGLANIGNITAILQTSSVAFIRTLLDSRGDGNGADTDADGINGENGIDNGDDGMEDEGSLWSLVHTHLAPVPMPSPLWATFHLSPSPHQPGDGDIDRDINVVKGKEIGKGIGDGRGWGGNVHHVLCLQSNLENRPNVIDGQVLLRQLRRWDVLSLCRWHRQGGYYCRWSLVDFVRIYGMLIDGLPTVLFAASSINNNKKTLSRERESRGALGDEGAVSSVPLLETCQLLIDHLTTLDNNSDDDAAAAAPASPAPAAVVVAMCDLGAIPTINTTTTTTMTTDHPTWHLCHSGVYLRTHHQWSRLENYRQHRAQSLVIRIQGTYRQHVARRMLMVTTHPFYTITHPIDILHAHSKLIRYAHIAHSINTIYPSYFSFPFIIFVFVYCPS